MKFISENLVIVTRKGSPGDADQVLVGEKGRGRFVGCDVFPGGKAEGTTLQREEAAGELEVIIEDPNFAHTPGKIMQTATLSRQDYSL